MKNIVIIFVVIILVNIIQANEATMPGRMHHQTLLSIVNDLKQINPPLVLIDSWIGYFLKEVYLRDYDIHVEPIYGIYDAKEYEMWLEKNEERLPNGTIMVANFASCVHYGCYNCGFQINLFNRSLSDNWILVKEYNYLEFSGQKPKIYMLTKR
jgi:hypothetical protein